MKISKRIAKYSSIVKRKYQATFAIWKSWKSVSMISVTDEAMTRAMVNRILAKYIQPSSRQHMVVLENATDEIIKNLNSFTDSGPGEKSKVMRDGALTQAHWFHAQLCGLTATWEFKIRLFGDLLGLKSNVPISQKARRNRNNNSVEHRKLSIIISEIHTLTGNRLNLKLTELSSFRDSIVHCNPQSMKSYAESVLGKHALKNFKGNVFLADFSGSPPINLSDLKSEHEVEEQPLFGWFIEVFNSGLPKRAFDIFSESIEAIDLLAHFKALSFDDCAGVFRKVVFEGVPPNEEEIAAFDKFFKTNSHFGIKDGRAFLTKITNCFRDLSI